MVQADNTVGARKGDEVLVTSSTGRVLRLAVLLYIMPLSLFFLGYFLAGGCEGRRAAVGCLAFALGMGICVLVSRSMKKNRREMHFTVDRVLKSAE